MKRNDAIVNSVGNSLGSSKRLGMRDKMQRNENSNDLVVLIRSFVAVWQPIIDVIHSEMTFIFLFQFDSDDRGAQRWNAARFLSAVRSRPLRARGGRRGSAEARLEIFYVAFYDFAERAALVTVMKELNGSINDSNLLRSIKLHLNSIITSYFGCSPAPFACTRGR